MIDITLLEDTLDVLFFDICRLATLLTCKRSLLDLQHHADEVEGLVALQHARLIRVILLPDLLDNMLHKLLGLVFEILLGILHDKLCRIESLLVRLANEDAIDNLGHLLCGHKLNDMRILTVLVMNSLRESMLQELVVGSGIMVLRVSLVQQLTSQVDNMEEVVDHDNVMLSVLGMNVIRRRIFVSMIVTALNGRFPYAIEHKLALSESDLASTYNDLLGTRSSCGTAATEVTSRSFVAHLAHATLAHHSHHLGLFGTQVSLRGDTVVFFTTL